MDTDDLTLSILEAVAQREGVPVTELDARLHDSVDVDSLESLLTASAVPEETTVTFTYCGYSVRVDGTGAVDVSPEETQATAPATTITP